MRYGTALRSSAAGITIGASLAGCLWWLDVSTVMTVGTGTVWAAALALTLYVFQTYPDPEDPGPWGAVIGGSLLSNILISLSDITISNGASAALTILVIGFTLLGYAAGMATVHDREDAGRETGQTTTEA